MSTKRTSWTIYYRLGSYFKAHGTGFGDTADEAIGNFIANNPSWQRQGLEAMKDNMSKPRRRRHASIYQYEFTELGGLDIGQRVPDWPAQRGFIPR